jgi:RNA polymerase sigma-70 factor (ECF subfamily)
MATVAQKLGRTEPEEWRLVDELYPKLHRFAAVAAPYDVDADDLLQDALVKVLRKHALSELDNPSGYLQRTMVNLAASHSRRMGRQRRALRRYASDVPEATDPVYPSDLAELSRLSPKDRAVLYLHDVEGFRFSEISEILGCTEASAKMGASRARRRLAHVLASEVEA